MIRFFQPIISCSLSPNTQADDVWLALQVLIQPWRWQKGDAIHRVEQWFQDYFHVEHVVTFNSGRSALLALLKVFNIGIGDEVLVQAFTCVAVPNSVLWAGATPVYVDIDDRYNIDPRDLEKKITSRTKALIVQHTFGIPAQMDKIVTCARKHKLILIEDCAHSLGATYKGKKVGTFGDGAFFSFGRDKVLSSVWGGVAVMSSKFKAQSSKLENYHDRLPFPSMPWILQQVIHPIAFSLILMSYNIYLGKIILVMLQQMKFLSFPVYPEEKHGQRPQMFPARYPNALAILVLNQLKKLDIYNIYRLKTVQTYRKKLEGVPGITIPPYIEGGVYLRFPLEARDAQGIQQRARSHGVYLGNWYHNIIDPKGVDFAAIGYQKGSCPNAEDRALRILNLPTRISEADCRIVLESIHETK